MDTMDKGSLPYLIVDGHSIIFAWDNLRKLHEQSNTAARDEFVRRMTAYQDITGERVVIVFDGNRKQTESVTEPNGIQVFYSKDGITADQIIERLAGKYADQRKITVASRDRAVLDTCSSLGAVAISANSLQELLEQAEIKLRSRLI